ncbi:hypothetical protein HCU64_17810 [Methylobacterium sp. C25]|uniref:hypothetical protein n=1 Tax=Methylobacterium sp. C25 TaxID=2721622 RepID=UPI001F1C207B|nr:hypothetical protein [Methylobacterium sp. C25]MCE4225612.1 hypothetical protein [Methylobacterium sp. C25]
MEPHRFEHDGSLYEVLFERTQDGWVARIRREGNDQVQLMAFPDGVGFDPEDPRGSLIAGCEAAVTRRPGPRPTRH